MSVSPRIILWDWDNTLVDAWAGVTAALNATFEAFGLPPWTVEDTRARARRSVRESFPEVFGAEWPRAAAVFQRSLAEGHLDHVAVMPGIPEALDAGARWRQGVVSNKDGAFLRREVALLGWGHRFGAVLGAGDAAADKPEPDPIWQAIDALESRPEADRAAMRPRDVKPRPDVWYIGDTALDMQAARAAGCTAVLVGDAGHDGGVASLEARGAAPDLHFADGWAVAARLRAFPSS